MDWHAEPSHYFFISNIFCICFGLSFIIKKSTQSGFLHLICILFDCVLTLKNTSDISNGTLLKIVENIHEPFRGESSVCIAEFPFFVLWFRHLETNLAPKFNTARKHIKHRIATHLVRHTTSQSDSPRTLGNPEIFNVIFYVRHIVKVTSVLHYAKERECIFDTAVPCRVILP